MTRTSKSLNVWGKDALDSLRDEALAVVRWDNDADFRQGGFH